MFERKVTKKVFDATVVSLQDRIVEQKRILQELCPHKKVKQVESYFGGIGYNCIVCEKIFYDKKPKHSKLVERVCEWNNQK